MIKQVYKWAKSKAWKKYFLPLQPLLLFVGLQIAAAIYLEFVHFIELVLIHQDKGLLPVTKTMIQEAESMDSIYVMVLASITGIFIYLYLLKRDYGIELTQNVSCINLRLVVRIVLISFLFQFMSFFLYDIIQNTVNFDISGESIRLKDNMDLREAVMAYLCIVLLGPMAEELLFRGLILNRAIKVMPFYKANLLQAFVFGAIHMGYFKLINGMILGYIQGYLVRKYKSFVVPIMMHIFVNLWPVLFAYLFEG